MSDDEQNNDKQNGMDLFTNNHDLIGVEGIIRSQKNEIEKKKVIYPLSLFLPSTFPPYDSLNRF